MTRPGILHLNTERGWRGGERQTLLLAIELSRRGYHQWIAALPAQPLAQAAERAGIAWVGVRPWGEWDLLTAVRLARFAERKGLSVVHAHTGHAVGLGALAKRWSRGRLRLVATRRVDNPLSQNPFGRWKYGAVDALAAVATKVAEVAASGGIARNKISVIHSGVDRAGYPTAADRVRLRAERGIPPNDRLVVSAGALVAQKDQETLLRAAVLVRNELPAVKFVVLGEGPLRPFLENKIRELGLESSVFLWGHRADVVECTAMGDVFVLSSVAEGIGGALIDAMAVEVPTASTRAGGVADLYGSSDAPELTPVGDADGLANNLLWVLRDPTEARRRVENGRRTASRFTAKAMADGYEILYGGGRV